MLGYANKEIADKLSISVKPSKPQTNMMQKLDLDSKHELIQYAIKINISICRCNIRPLNPCQLVKTELT
ncbi:LuxR C-terminal-related transcriptional regulator [Bacillus licheniformis]|nr:LuxR C-terminal-related transcriptional regulator [Bacillus licheniformis]